MTGELAWSELSSGILTPHPALVSDKTLNEGKKFVFEKDKAILALSLSRSKPLLVT